MSDEQPMMRTQDGPRRGRKRAADQAAAKWTARAPSEEEMIDAAIRQSIDTFGA
jgi:hypothetical protein